MYIFSYVQIPVQTAFAAADEDDSSSSSSVSDEED